MNRTELKEQCSKINQSSNGIIAIVSGSADFRVGDKVKLRGDMGDFKLTITAIHNDHYCTANVSAAWRGAGISPTKPQMKYKLLN